MNIFNTNPVKSSFFSENHANVFLDAKNQKIIGIALLIFCCLALAYWTITRRCRKVAQTNPKDDVIKKDPPPPRGSFSIDVLSDSVTSLINVHPSETIYDLKCKIQKLHKIPVDQLTLMTHSETLLDDKTIADYNFTYKSSVYFVQKLNGKEAVKKLEFS